jgi:hypothetical protein
MRLIWLGGGFRMSAAHLGPTAEGRRSPHDLFLSHGPSFHALSEDYVQIRLGDEVVESPISQWRSDRNRTEGRGSHYRLALSRY